MKNMLIAMILACSAKASDFPVGSCALVKPNNIEAPRGTFFVGKVGQVAAYLVYDKPTTLSNARRSVGVVLHFQEEPEDWQGFGETFLPKDLRAVTCPANFALKPYGFDPQEIIKTIKVLENLISNPKEDKP